MEDVQISPEPRIEELKRGVLKRITLGNLANAMIQIEYNLRRPVSERDFNYIGDASFSADWINLDVLRISTPNERSKMTIAGLDHNKTSFLFNVDKLLKERDWVLAEAIYIPKRFREIAPQRVYGTLYQHLEK